MISLTERARKKLQDVAESLPENHGVVWDIIFLGFG